MNKISISTFIFLGFCLNICLIIFLPYGSNAVNLVIRLTGIAGLIWLIYFYFQVLVLQVEDNQKIDNSFHEFFDVSQNAKTQFSDLITLAFTAFQSQGISNETIPTVATTFLLIQLIFHSAWFWFGSLVRQADLSDKIVEF